MLLKKGAVFYAASAGCVIYAKSIVKRKTDEKVITMKMLSYYSNEQIVPSLNHIEPEARDGDGISETDYVMIPVSASDEELGNAVIGALSRCKGRPF